jgi:short-subunit dehydrogenase
VIIVSSSLGTYSSSGSITYGASKAALTSWGRALAVAARREGIEVTVANPGPVVTTTFPHDELLQHRWKGRLVIDVERCVGDIMLRVDRGGGELWSHGLFRLPAILQAVAPSTYDRFFV